MKLRILFCLLVSPFFSSSQTITLFAGGGVTSLGDGGPATAANIQNSCSGSFDKNGTYYVVSSLGGHRIRKVDTHGIITTFAGTGVPGYNGDGIMATDAQLKLPNAVKLDSYGNIYISEAGNHRIRKIDKITNVITTVVGNGIGAFGGDGMAATAASINDPQDVCFDKFGNMYISEYFSSRVRKVNTAGIITTFAGNGTPGYSGDGCRADTARIGGVGGLCADTSGNIYIADNSNGRVFKVNTSGIITTFAGTGAGYLYNGDNIPATVANIDPYQLAMDDTGNLYVTEYHNYRVRKVDRAGIIHTVVGNGIASSSGDGGPATAASLLYPNGLAFDACGNLYVPEANNGHVRKITFYPGCDLSSLSVHSPPSNILETVLAPNPANSLLTIKGSTMLQNITIANSLGKEVFRKTYNSPTAEISVATLPSGIYLLRATDQRGNTTVKKFLKE